MNLFCISERLLICIFSIRCTCWLSAILAQFYCKVKIPALGPYISFCPEWVNIKMITCYFTFCKVEFKYVLLSIEKDTYYIPLAYLLLNPVLKFELNIYADKLCVLFCFNTFFIYLLYIKKLFLLFILNDFI